MATGQTLVFRHFHIEVVDGWLFYLLEEIHRDR
jgi:hypothetical protein